MMHRPFHFALVAFAWLLMTGPVTAQRPDTVMRKTGPPLRGQITQSSKLGLEIDGENTVETHEITRVMFGDEPSALRQAKDALADGNLEQARRALERVRSGELEREIVKADWVFAEAECAARLALQTGKGHGPAAKQMLDFIKANKNTFHFYEAAEWLGHLAVAMGRFDSAAKYFGQLEKAPWPDTQFRGKVLSAEALRAQGPDQLEAVLARYDAIANADVTGAEALRQKQIAILGRASVRAELGDAPGALAEIEAIIASVEETDAELLGQAYNALGAYHRSQQQTTDAVLAYLHVDLLFASNADAHAEALFYLSQLWRLEGKPDRGFDAANRLKTHYADHAGRGKQEANRRFVDTSLMVR